MVKIALDAMGGDNAPVEIVKGALDAVKKNKNIYVYLVGDEAILQKELAGCDYDKDRITIVKASEVIETSEHPVNAIRKKKDSSMVVAMNLVKKKEADAFVSAGNSGAVLVGGQTIVGRIKGVERSPFAPIIPTAGGMTLLLDAGANVDARASHLVQWARMGSIYMENVQNVHNPRVGIVNIGAEEEKGNSLVKETFPLLKECSDINFIGSVEARDIPNGVADVIVCDAFVGNVILKLYEGVGGTLIRLVKQSMMSSLQTKLGALLIKKKLKETLSAFDSSQYGGAPMLGLKGLVVKTHGSSKAAEITTTLLQCETFQKQDINGKLQQAFTVQSAQEQA